MLLAVAAVLLQSAALLLVIQPGVAPSRRILAATFVLLLPVAGVPLALRVRRARGGTLAGGPEARARQARTPSADDVRRLAELPSTLDRLTSPDAGERLAALVCLSGAADRDAVAALRWTLEHGAPEVVLDAALTLEDLDLRREARLEAASHAYRTQATCDAALAVGDAAAAGLLNGLADAVAQPVLAEQARTAYLAALAADPSRRRAIDERLARVEMAAGRPNEALELLSRLIDEAAPGEALDVELQRDAAAFAARRFDLMSLAPEDLGALATTEHPVFARLDQALERAADAERRSRPILADQIAREVAPRRSAGATGVFRLDPA